MTSPLLIGEERRLVEFDNVAVAGNIAHIERSVTPGPRFCLSDAPAQSRGPENPHRRGGRRPRQPIRATSRLRKRTRQSGSLIRRCRASGSQTACNLQADHRFLIVRHAGQPLLRARRAATTRRTSVSSSCTILRRRLRSTLRQITRDARRSLGSPIIATRYPIFEKGHDTDTNLRRCVSVA